MNWEAIGASGEIIGAVAVLLTLIYLARQIRHSADVSKVASYHEAINQIVEAGLEPDFAVLLAKYENGEALTSEEEARANVLGIAFLFGHEILFYLYSKGQVDEALWLNIFDNNVSLIKSQMLLPMLKNRPGQLSRKLCELVEASHA